jgi:class 3 adenylate cyclase
MTPGPSPPVWPRWSRSEFRPRPAHETRPFAGTRGALRPARLLNPLPSFTRHLPRVLRKCRGVFLALFAAAVFLIDPAGLTSLQQMAGLRNGIAAPDSSELDSLDFRFRWRGPIPTDPRLRVVAINDTEPKPGDFGEDDLAAATVRIAEGLPPAEQRLALLNFQGDQTQGASVPDRHVSENVAKIVIETRDNFENSLRGERKSVTALFSDIRGFTSIFETSDPEKLLAQLNDYFLKMVDAVALHQDGTLQKFIGDAINLAGRLENASKPFHCDLLVGQSVEELTRAEFIHRRVDLLRLKGKTKPAEVCIPLGPRATPPPPWLEACHSAIGLYSAQRFIRRRCRVSWTPSRGSAGKIFSSGCIQTAARFLPRHRPPRTGTEATP